MKTIKSNLKAQTCNLFSEQWYENTASLLSNLNKVELNKTVHIDPRFEKFQLGVKYYNSEITHEISVQMKTFLLELSIYCHAKGFKLTKGRTFKGRFFLIY
ncbi:hypothetical protein [Pedobacter antarcticus]|uniref:hypothetical protein n=1 Tax=Pedobacter antarcticus TaxID=34086 RepID=UPI00292E4D71|nr:hypothetical protein [Pedobacter antarcticus]